MSSNSLIPNETHEFVRQQEKELLSEFLPDDLEKYKIAIVKFDHALNTDVVTDQKQRFSKHLNNLRQTLALSQNVLDDRIEYVERLKRLTSSNFLNKQFQQLAEEFEDGDRSIVVKRWNDYFHCIAYAVGVDFGGIRQQQIRAAELARQIADHAKCLATALEEVANLGLLVTSGNQKFPGEFQSTSQLLLQTDNSYHPGLGAAWRWSRKYMICGDLPCEVFIPDVEPRGLACPDHSDSAKIDGDLRRKLWGYAPSVPMLIKQVGRAAESWEPQQSPFTNMLIGSQLGNPKTTYLHALIHMLSAREVPLIPAVIAKMAEDMIGEGIRTRDVIRVIDSQS